MSKFTPANIVMDSEVHDEDGAETEFTTSYVGRSYVKKDLVSQVPLKQAFLQETR